MKETLKEQYRTFLLEKGFTAYPSRSRKYDIYKLNERYVFLGSHGAIRYGKSPASTHSLSINLDQLKGLIKLWAKQ